MQLSKYSRYAAPVLRYGIGLLLLWFGLTNTFSPHTLIGYLPPWAPTFGLAPLTLMVINGIAEIILAALLLLGIFTRIAALLAALHMAGIAIMLGYNDIGVRDAALAISAFAVFLNGSDMLCVRK